MVKTQEKLWLGTLLVFLGVIGMVIMDATAKQLLVQATLVQVVFARLFFHSLFTTPWVLRHWYQSPHKKRFLGLVDSQPWGLHALRGGLLMVSSLLFFSAIAKNPIPDALTIFFIESLIVILLAHFFLREVITRHLIYASFFGFFGIFIILKPGAEGFAYHWTIFFALLAAISFAGYLVLTRFTSSKVPVIINSWLTSFFGLIMIFPFVFFSWQPLENQYLVMAVMVGLLSAIGHTLLAMALRYAPASYIAIFHYIEVPVAALWSWWIFAHIPSLSVWMGMSVIICANLYAVYKKTRCDNQSNRCMAVDDKSSEKP